MLGGGFRVGARRMVQVRCWEECSGLVLGGGFRVGDGRRV